MVDATFRHLADREAFQAAFARAAPLAFVECQAPAAILAARAADRDQDPGRVSDADLEVVLRERSSWEPLDDVPPHAHIALRTDRALEEIAADLHALLDRRFATLPRSE